MTVRLNHHTLRAPGNYQAARRPSAARCHLELGDLYLRVGAREEARRHLGHAVALFREILPDAKAEGGGGERGAKDEERLAEIGARLVVVDLGPQQGGQLVAWVGLPGVAAGRFLFDLTVEHDPRTDTIAGVPGQSRFKLTVFRTTPPPGPPAPCISSAGDLPAGDMVREDSNEHVCRSGNDLELTGRRLATDSFFTP